MPGPVAAPVTLDTFKDALAQHGVSCRIEQIRMIGQEDNRKRYVVEYRCADQPAAMVAFIPLQGNANPYEAIDCAAALTRGIRSHSPRPIDGRRIMRAVPSPGQHLEHIGDLDPLAQIAQVSAVIVDRDAVAERQAQPSQLGSD